MGKNLEEKNKSIGEIVYFLFFTVTFFRNFLSTTMIDYSLVNNVMLIISFVCGTMVTLKVLIEWRKKWGCYDIAYAIVGVGFILLANFYIPHEYVWEYLLLIVGAKGIDIKKILKVYLIISISLTLVTVMASVLGIIDNLIFYRDEYADNARYAMGFVYVTNFCAHLFFICAAYAFYRGKNIKLIEMCFIGAVGVICYVLSEGRNSTICIAMLTLVLICSALFSKNNSPKTERKLLTVGLTLFMPIISVLSILLAVLYDPNSEFMLWLNRILGHRPSMDAEAFTRYRVTLFGQNYVQKIFGGEGGIGFPKDYFFIDCSYVSILIRMGILALISIMIMWSLITYRECAKVDYLRAFVLAIVAVHCFMEHNILNISYNPFFLLIFAGGKNEYFKINKLEQKIKELIDVRVVKNCLSLVLFSVVVELLAFNMQSLTSIFKSYINVSKYETGFFGASVNEWGEYESKETMYMILKDVENSARSFDISLSLYSADEHVKMYNKEYTYAIFGYNEQLDEYLDICAKTVNTSIPSSGYIELDDEQVYDKYMVAFVFDQPCIFDIEKMSINGPKPFNVSIIRLAIIYALLVSVYYFGIEKRNAEVSPEVVELQKANDQFVATGALRTEAHRNMQAVYDAKSPIYIGLKRLFDIVCSGLAIVILSPIFIATAIAIKIEDNGPVFFVQKRAGKNLKPFKMWKFRSMYVNADEKIKEMMANSNEQTGHAFKMKNDPRITKVGKFIRKFSIDELPQLFNIFLGDMSIVGPRPILVFQMEECDDYDRQRLIVQPGLTCIWQVSGRANIKWDKWIELDLEYIEKMSVWTDIKLICLTVPCVLSGDGAY